MTNPNQEWRYHTSDGKICCVLHIPFNVRITWVRLDGDCDTCTEERKNR